MQSQQQVINVTVHEGHTNKFIDMGLAKGKWGEPTIYRHKTTYLYSSANHWTVHHHSIGDVLKGTLPTNGVKYTYVIKEFDGEWWKLEWPD